MSIDVLHSQHGMHKRMQGDSEWPDIDVSPLQYLINPEVRYTSKTAFLATRIRGSCRGTTLFEKVYRCQRSWSASICRTAVPLQCGIIDFPLGLLLQKLDSFIANVWEKKAKLYKAETSRQKLFPELGSLGFLKELLDPQREHTPCSIHPPLQR